MRREIVSPLPSERAKQLIALAELLARPELRRSVEEVVMGKLKEFERKQVARLLDATAP